MFTSLRRGPATLSRALRTINTSSRVGLNRSAFRSVAIRSATPARAFHRTSRLRQYGSAHLAREEDVGDPEGSNGVPTTITRFQQLADEGLLDGRIVSNITKSMGLENLTPVQSMTINETLKGIDVLAQAKTGTGKTLGFLLPVLHNILKARPELISPSARRDASSADVLSLIISPTRELAEQIAAEAKRVTRGTGIIVHSAVGGTAKAASLRDMQRHGCHLLVGTPGRLKDILSDRYSKVAAPELNTFVLDEADRLMDQGFWPHIQEIQSLLPDPRSVNRQTMMFSATMDRDVLKLVRSIMKPDFQFVRTVQDGEQPTHEKVPQKLVHAGGFENLMPSLLELCKREAEARRDGPIPFKAIVYFSSTAMVRIAAKTFMNLKETDSQGRRAHPLYPAKMVEMHARLSQAQRTKASEIFRAAKSGIMFSSDVTARGMDFPNVTHVIQIGCPTNREDYIHRLGRTARADKEGEGWLLVPAIEGREVQQRLRDLPLQVDDSLQCAMIDMSQPAQLPAQVASTLSQIGDAVRYVDQEDKQTAYLAYLGVYAMLPKQQLVDSMNRLAKYGWGLAETPTVSHGLATRLGLSRVAGINIRSSPNYAGGSREFGHGGGGAGERRSFGRGDFGSRNPSSSQGRSSYGRSRPDSDRSFGRSTDRPSYSRDGPGYGGAEERRPRSFEPRERRSY